MINTPIAYFIFNRPNLTKKSFKIIQNQKPTQLFIIADGPRLDNLEDINNCKSVRNIVSKIDWPCKVYHNYSESNLGLKNRVSSGLDWVFDSVDSAIILEDDCVAHPDFFNFCEILLERYFEDESISVITGDNFQNGRWRGEGSYYFSKYVHCWGWATWKRSWENFEFDIPFWFEWKNSEKWIKQMPDKIERSYWEVIFDRVINNEIDSWAYPWLASIWYHGGLTITPNKNLVSNIGFGIKSTHTVEEDSEFSNMEVENLNVIKHPKIIQINEDADKWTFDNHFGGKYLRFPLNLFLLPRRVLGYIYRKLKNFLITKISQK